MQIRSRFLTLASIGLAANAKEVPVYPSGWSAVLLDYTLKSDQIHANAAGSLQKGCMSICKTRVWHDEQ